MVLPSLLTSFLFLSLFSSSFSSFSSSFFSPPPSPPPPPVVLIPSQDQRLHWVGRRLPTPSGGFAIDWEGTQVQATIANATYVGVSISDTTLGGARFSVLFNNLIVSDKEQQIHTLDPNPYSDASPNLRTLTFATGPGERQQYTLASRTSIAGQTATYTLVLITEASFIGDSTLSEALVVEGFITDGIVLPATNQRRGNSARRRIEFLGDSLTAGYGSGFDYPPGAPACGAGVLINDWLNSYGALLCANFSAECTTEAVSGITLYTGSPTLPAIWGFELQHRKVAYNASEFVPDAVVINLGENDWNGNCGTLHGCTEAFTAAYVTFVERIAETYRNASGIPSLQQTFFLTIGPHEKGQSAGIIPAVATLQSKGYRAVFMNATVSGLVAGCGGHPGPTIHRATAQRAWPIIAQEMGWD